MKLIDIVLRLILAVVVGGIVGYERERQNRAAGFRTHILVCVGASVTSMIQQNIVYEIKSMVLKDPSMSNILSTDLGRLAAQVISGVGFLGVGTIIHEKGSVKGLTTAASLWTVACIGIAVGFGYYSISIASSICVYFVLVLLKSFEFRFIDRNRVIVLYINFTESKTAALRVDKYFNDKRIKIKNIEFPLEGGGTEGIFIYTLLVPRGIDENIIIKELSQEPYISSVRSD